MSWLSSLFKVITFLPKAIVTLTTAVTEVQKVQEHAESGLIKIEEDVERSIAKMFSAPTQERMKKSALNAAKRIAAQEGLKHLNKKGINPDDIGTIVDFANLIRKVKK